MAQPTGTGALPVIGRWILVRWVAATLAFPIAGFLGHLVGGPATVMPAALISGLIAGAVIGLGQALALGLRTEAVGMWTAATALGLGFGIGLVTATNGPVDTMQDAALLGIVSGIAVGAGQVALLARWRVANPWIWPLTSGAAWAIGWLVMTSIGVGLAAGWPVYGLSGAIVSQLVTGVVAWQLLTRDEAPALAPGW
jgi:hypothetical protein